MTGLKTRRRNPGALRKLSLRQRESLLGYLFTLPFSLGLILFVIDPFLRSIVFSLNKITITRDGYVLNWVGMANYSYSLFSHTTFVRTFTETTVETLIDVPLVVLFSLFAAILVNRDFKGKAFMRVILFLPVIMGSGIVLRMERSDFATNVLKNTIGGFSMGEALRNLLMELRMPEVLLNYTLKIVDKIPEIIKASGIQILVFLAGLQSIPRSLYEAAEVEGSTKWESFWKITLPVLSPMVLLNVFYTIVDTFTSPKNRIVALIRTTAFEGAGYGVSSAMAWIYFLSIALILGMVALFARKWVFYHN